MLPASFSIDPAFAVAPVNRRTFGSFVEHMGRCVYTGIYEPEHPSADEYGLRADVLELVRELGVTVVRYPGGNFVSGYRWEDGVGPVEQRPTRLDLAWKSIESNAFGLQEFTRWAAKTDLEVMLAINLGTRGMQEALDLLEYCNHPGGTYWSDLRRSHGAPEPYDIRMWCLGNEMDGPWQLGHKTPGEYGRLAGEVARAMRRVDQRLELVACGSSHAAMPTFGAWEAEVLEEVYDQVDYISAHAYYEIVGNDLASFLASPVNMDRFIDDVVSTADHVRAKTSKKKRINVSFDEWNVWYIEKLFIENKPPYYLPHDWTTTPRISEDAYTVADAVVVGGLLISLLRHSDRVTSACQAQLVNTGSMIRTEPGGAAWRQSIFHPFALTARHAKGTVLLVVPKAPVCDTAKHGEVLVLDAVATYDEETDEVVVFAVNRHQTEALELSVDARAFGRHRALEHLVLCDDDVAATNTEQQPDRVRPRPGAGAVVDGGRLTAVLPPVSWNMIRLEPARD